MADREITPFAEAQGVPPCLPDGTPQQRDGDVARRPRKYAPFCHAMRFCNAAAKHEIRISKSETNPKDESQMSETSLLVFR
ncbi:MAG: hypothetical protein ABR915_19815 [Thermoguttaceae bacterium]